MAESEHTAGAQSEGAGSRRVVVGIDGSSASLKALSQAVEEARFRGARLEVVYAWQYPFEMAAGNFAVSAPQDMAQWAEEVLDQAVASIQGDPGVEVVRREAFGPAVQVLMEVARGAELLVVGTRGHSRVTGLFLGSVSQYLAVHAPCPVLVVHEPAPEGHEAPAPEEDASAAAVQAAQDEHAAATSASAGQPAPGVLEEIPEEECVALLAGRTVGRLVVVHDGVPQAFPVNYVVDGRTVAVRTASGTPLDWAALGQVAFEVDDIDEERRRGWSVLVQGVGRDVTEGVDDWSERLRQLDLEPWAAGDRRRWIAIASPRITGRRIRDAADVGSPMARL
jgi:nucleotide-binding universal stress UspA family protein/nitroimidazol reductase NimA-like FMN-containing flavoprotein (pyridoxamine 5'-phosphate oxidase superfamily)